MSSGSTHDSWSASGIISRLAGVSMTLGMMALARKSPSFSAASVSVRMRTPAFEARYGPSPAPPSSDERALTLTTAPPASRRCGAACLLARNVVLRFTSSRKSNSSTSVPSMGVPPRHVPATFAR